jgi:hypothetical protein
MLLLRFLSAALCAAVAAYVMALVYLAPPAHVCRLASRAPRIGAFSAPVVRDRGIRVATAAAERSPGGVPVNVIDVAPGVSPAQIAGLIALAPGEHLAAVNERAPASDLEAGALIASRARRGEFLDLTVTRPAGERRVLVLLH